MRTAFRNLYNNQSPIWWYHLKTNACKIKMRKALHHANNAANIRMLNEINREMLDPSSKQLVPYLLVAQPSRKYL